VLLNVRVREKRTLDDFPAVSATIARVENRLGDRGRLLVRYSGTEPLLRIMLEGQHESEIRAWGEEIARVVGLDAVPGRALGRATPASEVDREYDTRLALRRKLAGMGFNEARNVSLVNQRELGTTTNAPSLKNPLSEDQNALRPSLLPGLVAAVQANADRGFPDVALFEVGQLFRGDKLEDQWVAASGAGKLRPRPNDRDLSIVLTFEPFSLFERVGPGHPAWENLDQG
jgi:hypothetical protein